MESDDFGKINDSHREFLINNVAEYLNITGDQLETCIELSDAEIAVTKSIGNNYQFNTFYNENIENYLNKENIDFKIERGVVTFPVTLSNLFNDKVVLAKSEKFINNNFDFSLIKVYYSGEEPVFWPETIGDYSITEPFIAKVYYWNDIFNVSTSLQADKLAKSDAVLSSNGSDVYFNGLNPSSLPIKASLEVHNFPYLLLKNIDAPVEFFNNTDGFTILIKEKTLTRSQLRDQIGYTLSTLWPDEINKELLDGTYAKNLVVNPENWVFESLDDQTEAIIDDNVEIYLKEDNRGYFISNSAKILGLVVNNNSIHKENCLFYRNSHLYVNIKNENLQKAVINTGFGGKINVCID